MGFTKQIELNLSLLSMVKFKNFYGKSKIFYKLNNGKIS